MAGRVVKDDDEQMIADLLKGQHRTGIATPASQAPIWLPSDGYDPDSFTISGSGDLDHTLTYLPLGLDRVTLNGANLAYTTDFTIDWTTGVLSLVNAPTAGDVLEVWYVTTGELIAASLPSEGIEPVDLGVNSGNNSGSQTSISSVAAFTPPANTLILVHAEWGEPSVNTLTTGISDTIGGLTWTEITTGWQPLTSGGSTRYAKSSVFWAVTGSSPPSGVITVTSSANTAMTFRAVSVPDANTTSPIGNTATQTVVGSFGTGQTVTAAPADSGASLVAAFLGINYAAGSPGTPTDDPAFTNLSFTNGAGSNLDASYSRSSHSSTWSLAAATAQFWYYQAIVLEING